MTDDVRDDELRELLRSRDPAASLPPADPAQVDRLLEGAMTHELDTRGTDAQGEPLADPRRRTPLTWLVAAAAVLVIAGVGAFAIFGGDDEPTVPTANDPAPSVMELSARPPSAAKCAVVTAELLAMQETAFDGTVSSLADGDVTLAVGHWYRGGDADQVTVQAPPDEMQALIQAVDFQTGQRYLVSASDGYVTACAMSAPYSDELAALYAEAFGG